MKPITREEYYLAKIAGTWQGKTPEPVTIEEYYLATMAGDYSGNTPQPVTRLQYYMAKAAGVWGGSIPAPVTRLEYYWAAIAGKEGYIPDPVTRQEYLLYAISQSNNDVINTVSGSTIIIADAAEGRPFRGLRVFGRTEQQRTTGAQLLDESKVEQNNLRAFEYINLSVGEGTFTLSSNIPKSSTDSSAYIMLISGNVQEISSENTTATNGVYKGQSRTFPSINGYVTIAYRNDADVNNIINFNEYWYMLNKGAEEKPYEPYTGGKPSPSPEYPQEIVSAGESGTINVSISDSGSQSQSLTLATPNGLPGVPVSKDGNYTDSNGQQWVCDEIDLERGKYIERTWKKTLDGSELWGVYLTTGYEGFFTKIMPFNSYRRNGFCDLFTVKEAFDFEESVWLGVSNSNIYAVKSRFHDPSLEDKGLANWKAFLAENPMTVMTYMDTPIERDLTPEEIAAYKALRTYGPTTVITNDAGAGMEVTYVAER